MKSQFVETLHKRVAGIDVHRMKHVVTVLSENEDGTPTRHTRHTREFGGFKRDLKALASRLKRCRKLGWSTEQKMSEQTPDI